jgi:hypothetical protein
VALSTSRRDACTARSRDARSPFPGLRPASSAGAPSSSHRISVLKCRAVEPMPRTCVLVQKCGCGAQALKALGRPPQELALRRAANRRRRAARHQAIPGTRTDNLPWPFLSERSHAPSRQLHCPPRRREGQAWSRLAPHASAFLDHVSRRWSCTASATALIMFDKCQLTCRPRDAKL